MNLLSVENLRRVFPPSKRTGNVAVVGIDGVSFTVQPGELFTLLGPSGCGKTTTLRSIAGLERPTAGRITVAGKTLFSSDDAVNIDANKRGLGMVFQSYAIWPHMNVFRNVAFPMEVARRSQRRSSKQIREQVERVLEVVQLGSYASRMATDLSGGQQQRLALARALVMEPPLLLLDEPLSNLDAKLREGMRFELMRLQREVGVTSIYVTHDQTEALAMSSRIAVMQAGKIEQIGTPHEIYDEPATRFVADFIGSSNFIAGAAEQLHSDGTQTVTTPYGPLVGRARTAFDRGAEVVVSVRPEHMTITAVAAGDRPSSWVGNVEATAFMGECVDHIVKVGELRLRVRTQPSGAIQENSEVEIKFDNRASLVLPAA